MYPSIRDAAENHAVCDVQIHNQGEGDAPFPIGRVSNVWEALALGRLT